MPLSLPFIIHCASFHCASFTLKRGIALVEKEALPFHISFTMKRGTISHFTTVPLFIVPLSLPFMIHCPSLSKQDKHSLSSV